jgi:hypothetical protein
MITRRNAFVRGLVGGLLLGLAANAGHWFISPASHPDATKLREWAVFAQLVFGVVGAVCMGRGIPAEPSGEHANARLPHA